MELVKNGKTTSITGYTCKTKLYGTLNNNSDKDEGMVIEFSIPKSYFEGASSLRVFMKMYGNDGGDMLAWDGFNGLTESKPATWHMVRLSSDKAMTEPPAEDPPVTTAKPATTTAKPATTTTPQTTSPQTTAAQTTAAQTTAAQTTAAQTTAAQTTAAQTNAHQTTAPPSTSPPQSQTHGTQKADEPTDRTTALPTDQGTQGPSDSASAGNSGRSGDPTLIITIVISAIAVALAFVYLIVEFRKLKKR